MATTNDKFNNLTIPQMLAKLDELYDKQEQIQNQVKLLYQQYAQISEDIDLAQTIIMYQSNKLKRKRDFHG